MNRGLLGSALFLFVALTACGDSDDPVAQTPERTVASIQLSAAQVSVDDGANVRLSATVLDQEGRAFSTLPAGTQVNWTVDAPTIASVAAVGAGLQADVTGERPGSARVTAAVAGRSAQTQVTVNQVATTLTGVSGDGQSAEVGATLPDPLEVRVLDRHGAPVPGISVTFAALAGGGSVSPASAASDAEGRASSTWTLGEQAGEQVATAQVSGLTGSPVEFRAEATEPEPQGEGTVEGVVTAANGVTPIQGALVRLLPGSGAGVEGLSPGAPGSSGEFGASEEEGPQAITDLDGRFRLEGVPAGPQTLLATRGVFRAEISVQVEADAVVQAPTLTLDAAGALAFVPGEFDRIEDILRERLGVEVAELAPMDLASPAITSQYRYIFINCGVEEWEYADDEDVIANLLDFVAGGGALYVSDLELPLVSNMFPDRFRMGFGLQEGIVRSEVVDPGLKAFLGPNRDFIDIFFDFDDWDAVKGPDADIDIILQADYQGDPDPVEDGPLAISIKHGLGQVVFTSFHNVAAPTEDQVAALSYFVFAAGGMDAARGLAPALMRSSPLAGATSFRAFVEEAGIGERHSQVRQERLEGRRDHHHHHHH